MRGDHVGEVVETLDLVQTGEDDLERPGGGLHQALEPLHGAEGRLAAAGVNGLGVGGEEGVGLVRKQEDTAAGFGLDPLLDRVGDHVDVDGTVGDVRADDAAALQLGQQDPPDALRGFGMSDVGLEEVHVDGDVAVRVCFLEHLDGLPQKGRLAELATAEEEDGPVRAEDLLHLLGTALEDLRRNEPRDVWGVGGVAGPGQSDALRHPEGAWGAGGDPADDGRVDHQGLLAAVAGGERELATSFRAEGLQVEDQVGADGRLGEVAQWAFAAQFVGDDDDLVHAARLGAEGGDVAGVLSVMSARTLSRVTPYRASSTLDSITVKPSKRRTLLTKPRIFRWSRSPISSSQAPSPESAFCTSGSSSA